MEKLKQYKEMIAIVLGVVAVLAWAGNPRGLAQNNKAAIEEQKTNIESQSKRIDYVEKTMFLMAQSIASDAAKLEGFLTAMGIDPDKAAKWSRYPKEPKKDSLGNIVPNIPWVSITDNVDRGIKYKVVVDTLGVHHVEAEPLWDFTKE